MTLIFSIFAEPLGALSGFLLVLVLFGGGWLVGVAFAAIVGIMVYVCLDNLFSLSGAYERGYLAIFEANEEMAEMVASPVMPS